MKITIETPTPGEEDEIIIRCACLDKRILNMIYALKSDKEALTGYDGDKIIKLPLKDIYYLESVDNRVYAYTDKEVYEVHKKLYELEQEYGHTDFMRISKSVIVNLAKIAYVKPIFNGRFETKLKNDEKLIISRQYVTELKKRLAL